MRITEDVRKYAAEQGMAAEDALEKGMEEKSREFVEKGAQVYTPAWMFGPVPASKMAWGIRGCAINAALARLVIDKAGP